MTKTRAVLSLSVLLLACVPGNGAQAYRSAVASYYHRGKVTASGERFQPDRSTFASRHMPFGTVVEFRHKGRDGRTRTVVARCNDRGPYVRGRTFDLSLGAARQLGMIPRGVATVSYRIVRLPKRESKICQQPPSRSKSTKHRTAKTPPRRRQASSRS